MFPFSPQGGGPVWPQTRQVQSQTCCKSPEPVRAGRREEGGTRSTEPWWLLIRDQVYMLLWDTRAKSPALGPPMILLWLLCAGVTGQEPCSSPGDFPSPKIFLSNASAKVGDSIMAMCSLPSNSLAELVIFCQDGKQLSSQLTTPGQSLYQYAIPVQRSGQLSCMYQYRNDQSQVKNSRLSLPQTLQVTGKSAYPSDAEENSSGSSENSNGPLRSAVIGGIVGLSVLCLVPLIFLLVKKVIVKQRHLREELPNHSTENTPTEEHIQYAALSEFGAARLPRTQESRTSTYAVVGKARGRPS